jgi:hypothetical protein
MGWTVENISRHHDKNMPFHRVEDNMSVMLATFL